MDEREGVAAVVRPDKPLDPFPTKEILMTNIQRGVDDMIRTGKLPKGTMVTDIRIQSVEFLVKLPDGRGMELEALLKTMPGDESGRPMTYFGPAGNG